jgi:cytochrome c oxidase subunit 2
MTPPSIHPLLLAGSASTGGRTVDTIFIALLIFSGGLVLMVGWLVLWFSIRYRAGSRVDRTKRTRHVHGWEAAWISIFSLIGIADFVWASEAFLDLTAPPRDARVVYAVGRQWMWKVEHPEGPREINELHVPAGEPVRVLLSSQDVIHSFFLPAFRVKQDALPDRFTSLWFRATEPGEYPLYCAEYCGTDHSAMRGRIVVMSPAEYERWLSSSAPEPAPVPGTPGTAQGRMSLRGEGLFHSLGCNACHLRTGDVLAPRLDGLWGRWTRLQRGEVVRVDESYLRESILQPNAKIVAGYPSPSLMPTYQGRVGPEDLNELVEFIRSLEHGWPAETPAPPEKAP